MKKFIKNKLREDLEYYHTGDNNPEVDSFEIGVEEGSGTFVDKWEELEYDIKNVLKPIIKKHSPNFGYDSYAVIDAIQQVFDNMFQRV